MIRINNTQSDNNLSCTVVAQTRNISLNQTFWNEISLVLKRSFFRRYSKRSTEGYRYKGHLNGSKMALIGDQYYFCFL